MQEDIAAKPKVTADQRRLLESRYDLTPRVEDGAKMSRGTPLAVGPTERLRGGDLGLDLAASRVVRAIDLAHHHEPATDA